MRLADPSFDPIDVKNALQDILGSQYFRSSAQCSSLLRYMVENTLADRDERLRERVIGYEVFDRAPDYDTGNDHVVRSRASEVRKRLAQYYQDPGAKARVRVSIPSGSYRASFDPVQISPPRAVSQDLELSAPPLVLASDAVPASLEEVAPVEIPRRDEAVQESSGAKVPPRPIAHRARRIVGTFVVLATLAVVGLLGRTWMSGQSAFDRFWAPLNKSPKPALIYCGGGFVYKLSNSFLDGYRLTHGQKDTRREFFVDLKPGESVPSEDLIPDKHFVPFGDLASTGRIVTTLAGFKKPYDLRYGDDLAFTEFHTSPVILIGGLNNSWALKIMHNLRFVLEDDDRIVDQWNRARIWTQRADPDSQARDDYAIVSRLNSPENGTTSFVLSVAGIRMYGTRAAAELISDPARLNQILKDLPRGWEGKNLQVVIHTKTMNEISIAVNVEAMHSW